MYETKRLIAERDTYKSLLDSAHQTNQALCTAIEALTADNTAKDAEIERLQADLCKYAPCLSCEYSDAMGGCLHDDPSCWDGSEASDMTFPPHPLWTWRGSQDGGGQDG